MKVRMKAQILGTRNGIAWPAPGGVKELPDHEGAKLCAAGLAEVVAEVRAVAEKRPHAAKVEKRKG